MLHKLRKKMKTNAESLYSNLGGGAHDHIDLVHTEDQFAITSNTPFVGLPWKSDGRRIDAPVNEDQKDQVSTYLR